MTQALTFEMLDSGRIPMGTVLVWEDPDDPSYMIPVRIVEVVEPMGPEDTVLRYGVVRWFPEGERMEEVYPHDLRLGHKHVFYLGAEGEMQGTEGMIIERKPDFLSVFLDMEGGITEILSGRVIRVNHRTAHLVGKMLSSYGGLTNDDLGTLTEMISWFTWDRYNLREMLNESIEDSERENPWWHICDGLGELADEISTVEAPVPSGWSEVEGD